MFFERIQTHSKNLAILEYNESCTKEEKPDSRSHNYAELEQLILQHCQTFSSTLSLVEQTSPNLRKIIVYKMTSCTNAIAQYLALLRLRVVIILVSSEMSDEDTDRIAKNYAANAVIGNNEQHVFHTGWAYITSSLALIMPTSGTTGKAKFVALSYANIQANAESICEYLPITKSDRALCTLPMHYSYGLSVLHSHLLKGAALILSPFTVMSRPFWDVLESSEATSFSGVPHIYEMLERLRLRQRSLPKIRYFTQAGGKLSESLVMSFGQYARDNNKAFFVMYGQTEATARMAYLSPSKVLDKPASIGQAIPGGEFKIVNDELCYSGDNVMLGYCEHIGDLASFKPQQWLRTGDLARVDCEGDYYITGRIKRMVKLFGKRFDLDAIERLLKSETVECMCIGRDQEVIVAVAKNGTDTTEDSVKRVLHQKASIHPTVTKVSFVENLPINSNGKPDYLALKALLCDG